MYPNLQIVSPLLSLRGILSPISSTRVKCPAAPALVGEACAPRVFFFRCWGPSLASLFLCCASRPSCIPAPLGAYTSEGGRASLHNLHQLAIGQPTCLLLHILLLLGTGDTIRHTNEYCAWWICFNCCCLVTSRMCIQNNNYCRCVSWILLKEYVNIFITVIDVDSLNAR